MRTKTKKETILRIPIQGTNERYFICSNGDVIDTKYNRLCPQKKTFKKRPGYNPDNCHVRVAIWYPTGKQRVLVHRLVAIHFIPNPDNKPQVNHMDGIKDNNNVDNLEWVTGSENMLHSYRVLGNTSKPPVRRGAKNPAAKLSQAQVDEIRSSYKQRAYTTYKLAELYQVSRRTISNIINNKSW